MVSIKYYKVVILVMCSLHEAHYMMAKSVSSPEQLTLAHSVVNHDSSVNTVIRPWADGQVLHTKAGGRGFFLSASVIFPVSDSGAGPLNA